MFNKPCTDPKTKGNEAPNKDTTILLVNQNIDIAITTPKADNHKEYQRESGNFKLGSGVKKDKPIKFWLVVAKLLGFPLPYHLPKTSTVSDVKTVVPDAEEGIILEAITLILDWSLLK